MVFLSRKGPTDPHADRLLGYPHRHNLSACSALICMFYPRVRPPFASRPPSTGSAICCEQIATHERTSTHSVQNSPNTPPPAAHPVQNSPSAPVLQRFREKVRPVHPTPQQNREKVRPVHLKTAFFASFAPAGRIFSRSHPHQAEQGELIRAEDLTGRDDGATLKPPTPLFTIDRPRSSHRLYGRHQQRKNANSPRRVPPQRNAHPTPPARQTGGRHQQCAGAAHPLCQE